MKLNKLIVNLVFKKYLIDGPTLKEKKINLL